MNLADVDLVETQCPNRLTIEIEGMGKMGVNIPNISLLTGIAHIYCIKTGETVYAGKDFLKRVTLTGLDVEKKIVKVRISEAANPIPLKGFSSL